MGLGVSPPHKQGSFAGTGSGLTDKSELIVSGSSVVTLCRLDVAVALQPSRLRAVARPPVGRASGLLSDIPGIRENQKR